MSENLKTGPESHQTPAETDHLLPTPEQAEPLRRGEKDPAKMLEEARAEIEESGEAGADTNPLDELQESERAAKTAAPGYVSGELRKATLNRQLGSIRRSLSVPGRAFSKVIHQPVIRVLSEPAGKTVSRPSGLLGGGLVAFIGTSAYLYLARQSGMRYSYFVFLGLFLGGFAAGLLLEMLIRLAAGPRRASRAKD